MIRAVCFDVGSTLVYPSPSVPKAFGIAAGKAGFELPQSQIDAAYPALGEYYEKRYLDDGDFWCSEAGSIAFWNDYYAQYCHLMGLESGIGAIVAEMSRIYTSPEGWALYDDVVPLMGELRRQGILIGVISNWGPDLKGILGGLGMGQYCDGIAASATIGYRKPDPRIFNAAFEMLGVGPGEVLHVGDLPEADGSGAISAGATPLIIDRKGSLGACGFRVIRSLAEVLGYLG